MKIVPKLKKGNKVLKRKNNLDSDNIMYEAGDVQLPKGIEYINVAKPFSNGNPEDYIGPAFVGREINGPNDTIIRVQPYDTQEWLTFRNTDKSHEKYDHYSKLFRPILKSQSVLKGQIVINGQPATYILDTGWITGNILPEVIVAKKKGGIMKGLNTSDIPKFNIPYDFSNKQSEKRKIGPTGLLMPISNDELPQEPYPFRSGDFVGNDTSLQDRGFEVTPQMSEGEKAVRRFKKKHEKQTYIAPFVYKKGGIVKGQDDLDTDTDIDSTLDPFERARLHNAREAEISRQYFNSTPSIGNLARGFYHWWMSVPSLGGETGYVTGTAPTVGFAKGANTIKLATRTLNQWNKLKLNPGVKTAIEEDVIKRSGGDPAEYSGMIRHLMKLPGKLLGLTMDKFTRRLEKMFSDYVPLNKLRVRTYTTRTLKQQIEDSRSSNTVKTSNKTGGNWAAKDKYGK